MYRKSGFRQDLVDGVVKMLGCVQQWRNMVIIDHGVNICKLSIAAFAITLCILPSGECSPLLHLVHVGAGLRLALDISRQFLHSLPPLEHSKHDHAQHCPALLAPLSSQRGSRMHRHAYYEMIA
jgi:hypothetical protein